MDDLFDSDVKERGEEHFSPEELSKMIQVHTQSTSSLQTHPENEEIQEVDKEEEKNQPQFNYQDHPHSELVDDQNLQNIIEEGKMDVVDITTISASDPDESFTVYSILVEVELPNGRVRWEVSRRFRQFNELHKALLRNWGGSSMGILPHFPSKAPFQNKNNQQLVHQRRLTLTKYLSELLQKRPDISGKSYEIHSFLETRSRLYGEGPIRKKILIPLPLNGHDVAQVSIGWKLFSLEPGYRVYFAVGKEDNTVRPIHTPKPEPMYEKPPPSSFIASTLAPNKEARFFYKEMEQCEEYKHPLAWEDIDPAHFDALLITGGYTQGVAYQVSNQSLQKLVVKFWKSHSFENSKVVGAIDRGTLVLSRSSFPETRHSVLYSYKTTALPKWIEKVSNYVANTFAPMDAASETDVSCSDQVRRVLSDPENLISGPSIIGKGTWFDDSNAFVVQDHNYFSGRWTGDIYLLIKKMIQHLESKHRKKNLTNGEHSDEEDEEHKEARKALVKI